MFLTRQASWCSCSSWTASSLPPSCTWLYILVPPCGRWTSLPGWSLWSASPLLSDILHTKHTKNLIHHLVRSWLLTLRHRFYCFYWFDWFYCMAVTFSLVLCLLLYFMYSISCQPFYYCVFYFFCTALWSTVVVLHK